MVSVPAPIVEQFCQRYNVGSPLGEPVSVTGGLLHRMYRLETTQGCFALKVLNPDIMAIPHVRDEFRRSEQIAMRMAQHGIPAVVALHTSQDPIREVEGIVALLYPWIDGTVLPQGKASTPHARQIGVLLARIHQLNVPSSGVPAFHDEAIVPPLSPAPWEDLVRQAREQGLVWASNMEAALPDLFRWHDDARNAAALLGDRCVISHRDLDQKNVLWSEDDTPFLIDWESVGPIAPALEVIGAALDWGGQGAGMAEPTAFVAVLEGYRQHAHFPPEVAFAALQCRLAGWLPWLEVNLQRSLREATTHNDEESIGLQQTVATLATMYTLAQKLETMASWCDS